MSDGLLSYRQKDPTASHVRRKYKELQSRDAALYPDLRCRFSICLGPSSVTGNPKILADAVAACGLFTGFGDIVGGGKK